MNAKQRGILIAGVILVLLIGLFPPWTYVLGMPLGVHFIFAPPQTEGIIQIDAYRLKIEYITLALVIGGLFFIARPLKREETK